MANGQTHTQHNQVSSPHGHPVHDLNSELGSKIFVPDPQRRHLGAVVAVVGVGRVGLRLPLGAAAAVDAVPAAADVADRSRSLARCPSSPQQAATAAGGLTET